MENTKDNTDIKLYFYTINVIPKELKTGQVEEKKKKWQMSKNPLIKHVFISLPLIQIQACYLLLS